MSGIYCSNLSVLRYNEIARFLLSAHASGSHPIRSTNVELGVRLRMTEKSENIRQVDQDWTCEKSISWSGCRKQEGLARLSLRGVFFALPFLQYLLHLSLSVNNKWETASLNGVHGGSIQV